MISFGLKQAYDVTSIYEYFIYEYSRACLSLSLNLNSGLIFLFDFTRKNNDSK